MLRAAGGLSVALVVQTFGLAATGLRRMELYIDALGLSVLRLYASLGMLTFCLLLGILLAGILTRRHLAWLVARQLLAGALVLSLTACVNVDGLVARTNLERARHGAEIDIDYLAKLSADAIPPLEEAAASGDGELARGAARALESLRAPRLEPATGLGGWNLSRARNR